VGHWQKRLGITGLDECQFSTQEFLDLQLQPLSAQRKIMMISSRAKGISVSSFQRSGSAPGKYKHENVSNVRKTLAGARLMLNECIMYNQSLSPRYQQEVRFMSFFRNRRRLWGTLV